MEGVVRTIYRPDFNRIFNNHPAAYDYVGEHGGRAIPEFLEAFLSRVEAQGGDAVLQFFLAEDDNLLRLLKKIDKTRYTDSLDVGSISFVVYPASGEIVRYYLNPTRFFMSNAHQNTDPLITRGLKETIYLNPEEKKGRVRLPTRKRIYAPNFVSGGVFFKKPVETYPGFDAYLKYRGFRI